LRGFSSVAQVLFFALFIGCALAIPLERKWDTFQAQVEQPTDANLLVVDGETWSYIGCFQDDADRDFETGLGYGYDQDISQTACAQYAYFALQNSGQCFCDNSYSAPSSEYPKLASRAAAAMKILVACGPTRCTLLVTMR
jgi:hypothetical protein